MIKYAYTLCLKHEDRLKNVKDVEALYLHVLHHPTRDMKDLEHDVAHHLETITKIHHESFKHESHHLEVCRCQKPMQIEKQIYRDFERSLF